MTREEALFEKNKKGEFANWKNLNSYLKKIITDKDFFLYGTGSGIVYTVIIKDGKLKEFKTNFYWSSKHTLKILNEIIDFIYTAD